LTIEKVTGNALAVGKHSEQQLSHATWQETRPGHCTFFNISEQRTVRSDCGSIGPIISKGSSQNTL